MSRLTNEKVVSLYINTCEDATIDNVDDINIVYENKYSNLSIYFTGDSIVLRTYKNTLVEYNIEHDKYVVNQRTANRSHVSNKHRHLFLQQVPKTKVLFLDYKTILNLKEGIIQKKLKRERDENTINKILEELKKLYDCLEFSDIWSQPNEGQKHDETKLEILKLFFTKGKELK